MVCKDRRLKSRLRGQHRRGMRSEFAQSRGCANLVRTSRPECGCNVVSGGRLSDVVLPRFAVCELSSGTAGSNPAVPAHHADRPPNRKELAVDRAAKAESITELNGVFKTSNVVVVAHYSGLSVARMQTLRKQMKQAGAQLKVAKNRLAKIALKDTDAAAIAPLLKGPAVIAFSGDPVAAPK